MPDSERFTCYAASEPAIGEQLARARSRPRSSLTLDQTCNVGAGDEHEVVLGGELVVEAQNASRSARLTAFRSTAPPTLRLTEMPRRTSSASVIAERGNA